METQYHLVVFVNIIMIDTLVNSDWAKTIITTFVLKIVNSKSVPKITFPSGGLSG